MSKRDFALVVGVALALRLLTLFELHGTELATIPLGDARGYVDWARRIAGGEWLGGEVFYQAPLYPYLLALCFRVAGEGLLLPRILQATAGALACGWIGKGATNMGGVAAGRAAGFLAAVYAPWIWTDGLLQKTSLALSLTVALFALCNHLRSKPSLRTSFSIGVVAALLILTRENTAVLLFPCGWFVARYAGCKGALLGVAGLALFLLPVGFRNQMQGDSFLPTASNFGVNLYIGNGPAADGFYVPLLSGRGHTDYEEDDARTFAEGELERELTPGEMSAFFRARAMKAISGDPLRFMGLLGRKLLLLLNGREYMDAVSFEAYREESVILSWLGLVCGFSSILPLAVLGLFVCARRDAFALLLALGAATLVLSLLPFFVSGRFRMGLLPLLLPFAGAGVALLQEACRERRWKAGRLPVFFSGLALAITWLPLGPGGDPLSTTHANLTSEYIRRGEFERAESCAAKAIEADAGNADAHYNLGVALKFQGRVQESLQSFLNAERENKAYAADVWAELGSLHAMRNRLRAAKQAIDKSLGLDPTHAMANYYGGLLHRQAGEQEEAAAAYERALRQRPRFADARHNLAHVRLTQGRLAEALQALRETVDRSPDFLPSLSLLGLLLSTHPDDAVRDGPAALRYAERALELSGESDGDAHATRAFALAELGRFAEALEALEVAAQHSSVPTQWDEVVVLLQAGKPFRVDPLAGTGAD